MESDDRILVFLQDTALDGIWYQDLRHPEHEWVSPGFWVGLGYDPADTFRHTQRREDITYPRDLKLMRKHFEMHRDKADEPYEQVIRYRHRDGSTVNFRCRATAVRNGDGEVTHVLGTHVRLTGLNDVAPDETGGKKSDTASRLKTVFLTDLSHDLRTPLNSLLAMAEVLASTPLEPDQREMLDDMTQAGEQLTNLLSDMVDIAKIESGEISMEREVFSPANLLRDVEAALSDAAGVKGLRLFTEFPAGTDVSVIGAAKRIRQVVINLVSNAIRYTPTGSVTLAASMIPSDAQEEAELTIRITDTGPGVPDKLKPQVLRRFETDPGYLFASSQGLGMGLSIADTICRLHGGTLTVRDSPVGGAEFTAVFKVLKAGAVRDVPQESSVRPFRGMKMLIAEDVLLNRRSLKQLLADTDIELTFAMNGEEALRLLKDGAFEVALIDLRMPRMSGLEVLEEYRVFEKQQSRQRLYAIACSAYITAEGWPECEAAGFQDVLEKPFTKTELLDVVRRSLDAE